MPEPKHYFIGGIIVKPYEGTACDKWNVVGIDFCEIDINTLCQYTGLTDKNGQKIWENDIVVLAGACGRFVCKWADYIAKFIFENDFSSIDFVCYRGDEIEVVGNVFDNADLLEVE